MRRSGAIFGAVLATAFIAASAGAQTLEVSLQKDTVPLGDMIVLELKVTNAGKSTVDVPDFIPDGRNLMVNVTLDPKSFSFRRYPDRGISLNDLPRGQSVTATLEVPTVQAGALAIEVRLGASSVVKKVNVLPGPAGETRVGVRWETSKGTMVCRLFPEIAPNTVHHVLWLVRKKFYDGLTFHRIIPDFMMQGGDPSGDGSGGPGWSLPAEFTTDLRYSHTFGRLSMARTEKPDSAGSQIFVAYDQCTGCDGSYTVFGELTEGQETARAAEKVGSSSGATLEPVTIQKATIVLLPAK